jgi:hypothetical protein
MAQIIHYYEGGHTMNALEITAHPNSYIDAQGVVTELDEEWVLLILEALESGITADEIRAFLTTH